MYWALPFIVAGPGQWLHIQSTDSPKHSHVLFGSSIHTFMPVNGFWHFCKTQLWPISVSLSGIKKNNLKMYTNPLLCQQDSRVIYVND